jgi:flagellar assembly protein FliH
LIPKERLAEWARFELGTFGKPTAEAAPAKSPDHAREREAAETEGRQAGFRAGFAEGRTDAQRFAALAAALDAQLAAFEELHAERLADLALEIARQVLRGEPRLARAPLVGVVREALAALPEGLRRPHIVLHPADVAMVRAHLGDTLERGHWAVVEDHRIAPGGCRVETDSGSIDATLAARWRCAAAALGRDLAWDDE